jgi:hypothetical protein
VESPRYTTSQLLDFILLCLDERTLSLLELLSFYSHHNHRYIQISSLLCSVFGRLASQRRVWGFAFSILAGAVLMVKFPKRFQIGRPAFVSMIIEMVAELLIKAALTNLTSEDTNEIRLLPKVVTFLLTIRCADGNLSVQPNCILLMHNLANLV